MSTKPEQYIDSLTAVGAVSFTIKQFRRERKMTRGAALVALQRLKKQKKITSPSKGYYLILTPEFRKNGCLPPDFFIDDLMRHWNKRYYVSLLSAALYYGAAHQQPQIFQVMTKNKRENIHCGNVRIEFIKNNELNRSPITKIKTRTGYMNVSTPEATAMDMMKYMRQCGGINRVVTVIEELSEKISADALVKLAKQSREHAWVHRLGFLLDKLELHDIASKLHKKIDKNFNRFIPLVPYASITGAPRNKKWEIAINTNLESDLDDSH